MRSRLHITAPTILGLALGLAATGCMTVKREKVFESEGTKVILRTQGKEPRGFDQPIEIAPVRLAHVLSRIDVRTTGKDGPERDSAIPLETLYIIADAMASGLAQANSNQEVVVYSIFNDKRWGIFDQKSLTSFICYVDEGRLYIHLSRTSWRIEERRDGRLPEPEIGEFPMKFSVVPSASMDLVDKQSVSIDWRNQVFAQPTRTRMTPDGKVVRRVILMETPPAEDDTLPVDPGAIPANVSADTLRDLADLEDLRKGGMISEAQYESRRRAILEGAADPDPSSDP